jgi:hypothetical protein
MSINTFLKLLIERKKKIIAINKNKYKIKTINIIIRNIFVCKVFIKNADFPFCIKKTFD